MCYILFQNFEMNFAFLNILLMIMTSVEGERILFFTPIASKSHKIFFMGITEALAQKGHQVTMVSSYEPDKVIPNVREIIIKNFDVDDVLANAFESNSGVVRNRLFNSSRYCSDSLGEPQVQQLKNEEFDLIIISIFFDFCYLSFVHHFKIPFIYVSPNGLYEPMTDIMGSIAFPALVPSKLMDSSFPLTFTQRTISAIMSLVGGLVFHHYLTPEMLRVCHERGLCPSDMPPVSEINKNASLVIINSVRTLEWPLIPTMPNVIYAGGVHIKPPQKLSQDLEDWISSKGKNGFIFFSLGSALRPSFMPEKYRRILLKVFGSLDQGVLWKWDEATMPELPPNVKLSKWLPQQDILGHPKLKLFITHGGLLSTLESTYHGIPVIGMPVFADQFGNMRQVEREGWGKVMEWQDLEKESFREMIMEAIHDDRLRKVSQERSVLMRDLPISPSENAVYWVEYVMRHKGAPHIMSPVHHMKWYEVYNIDVWAFIIFVLLFVLFLQYLIFKVLFKRCLKFWKKTLRGNQKEKQM